MIGLLIAILEDTLPASKYVTQKMSGWVVHIHPKAISTEPKTWATAKQVLEQQLFQITRVVPKPALEKLQKVPIWVEWKDPEVACMCYHPGADWLLEHKLLKEKVKCVELGQVQNFLDWTKNQPWMVFHELAHAYHDRFLTDGFENKEVLAAFKTAMADKKYQQTMFLDGRQVSHYAKTNQMEFFAECSESLFGTNDFYPFVRGELKEYDPKTFEVIKKAWGL